MAAVQDFLILDARWVNEPAAGNPRYDWTPSTPACIAVFAMLIYCSISRNLLHLAASNGHVDVVRLLLSCNAAVDARERRYCCLPCIVDDNMLLIFCASDICS